MIRFGFFIIQFIIIFTIIGYLINNSFLISFDIGNYNYSFSSNLFLIFFIIILFIFYVFQYLYLKTRFSFQKYILKNKYKKIEKGYSHFVDAMIAIANKDNKKAISSNKKMMNYIKDDPSLSLLLNSEVLKIEKNYEKLTGVYEDMIKRKNTESLGYRGLMEQNLNNQDYHHAFIYGERLFTSNPKIEKLYETLIQIISKTKNWHQMIKISEKAYNNKIINKSLYNENISIAYYEIAKIKMHSEGDEAERLILNALKLKKYFVPYIELYLKIISQKQENNKFLKNVKKYWYEKPSSLLRLTIIKILEEKKLNDLKSIKFLIDKNFNNPESKKLLIYFAIHSSNWSLARDNVKGLIGLNPTKEICLFMSDIELGENNDIQKSDSWKLRAQNAQLENLWICSVTNSFQKEWESVSQSGYFNSLEWKQPIMLNKYYE